jgi:ribosomal-protein-alanine N-acetyltransferase
MSLRSVRNAAAHRNSDAKVLTGKAFRVSDMRWGRTGAQRRMSIIRSARQDEAEVLAAIGIRAWESAVNGWVGTAQLRSNAERAFSDFTRRNFLTIDVAEQGGQPTAWAARENLDNRITDLWVDPIWQRQGFGRMLLAKLEDEIAAQGYDTATVETHSENIGAIDFFKHQGYAISWMTATWSPQLDRDVDTVGMVKPLVAEDRTPGYGQF